MRSIMETILYVPNFESYSFFPHTYVLTTQHKLKFC